MALREASKQNVPKLLTRVHCQFGNFEQDRGDYTEAERRLMKARELAPDPLRKADANALLGNMYRFSALAKDALPYCQESVNLRESKETPNSRLLSQALRYLADCYRDLGNFDEALPIYERAIKIVENQPERKWHLAFACARA